MNKVSLRDSQDTRALNLRVLKQIATECRCTLVAMAAVFGANDTLPDVTDEAARRLELKVAP